MFGVTQIVAIDDSEGDLRALVRGLNQLGSACLGIHYSNAPGDMTVVPCPHVRVVITDLNLLGLPPGSNYRPLFAAVATVLRQIRPRGPYLLVAWTRLDKEAEDLKAYLEDNLNDVTKPFNVTALEKALYIDEQGNVIDLEGLMTAIENVMASVPALGTLCDWERQILQATGETLTEVSMLGRPSKSGAEQRQDLPRLLTTIVRNSVGIKQVAAHPFRAVTEALMPILMDRVSGLYDQAASQETWSSALSYQGKPNVETGEAALLNKVFHFAEDIGLNQGAERGAVIPLPERLSGANFEGMFGMPELDPSHSLFRCKDFRANSDRNRWVLVQAQAACDFAQKNPGPIPFYLAMEIEESAINSGDKPPQSLWMSPKFLSIGSIRQLQVNTRIQLPLVEAEARLQPPSYRIREQLLAQLLHFAQGNSARPGIVSF